MDTVTHGITGALIAKGFFSEKHGRVATWALSLGSIFPDCDVLFDPLTGDALALLKYHRGISHSFVALPFFAAGLAWLTGWYTRRRKIDCPSWPVLFGIYALAIAGHIFMDVFTSFGTMIWYPVSRARISWDWVFIVDFVFTGIVLLPQVAHWVYSGKENSRARALRMWALFSLCAIIIHRLARFVGTPFSVWALVAAIAILAALFFLPERGGWGFRVARSSWCRAGCWMLVAYVACCAAAHHAALGRVQGFVARASQTRPVDAAAAIPLPPSLLAWRGLIHTPEGVYQARFSLKEPAPPSFHFFADSEPDRYTAAALELPEVKTYLRFARFPVIRSFPQDDKHIVDLLDLRFFGRRNRDPQPFTYRVVFEPAGKVIRQGWVLE